MAGRWFAFSRALFGIIIFAWLAWVLWTSGLHAALGNELWRAPSIWTFLFAWSLLPLGLAVLWRTFIQCATTKSLPLGMLLKVQALAWGGRYLPGKAGLWIAKLTISRKYGVSRQQLVGSVFVEQSMFVLAGLFVVLVTRPWTGMGRGSGLLVPESASILASHSAQTIIWFLATLMVLGLVVATFWIAKRYFELDRIKFPKLLAFFLGYVSLHVVLGIGLSPFVFFASPQSAEMLGWGGIVGALAFANVAGILAVFSPAGLGVRELGLAIFLMHDGGLENALALAAFLRIITLVSDCLFVSIAWLVGRFGFQSDAHQH